MTAFFSTTCPSCGAPVEAHSATAVTLVCAYCRSTLVRHGENVDTTGRHSALLEDFSPLCIGTTGEWNGARFTLRGRLQVQYSEGVWNEWYAVFDNGQNGWLSESGDRYVFTLPAAADGELPEFSDIIAGLSRFQLNGWSFVAADVREIVLNDAAAEGELPFRLPEKQTRKRVSDWRYQHLFLTIDYGSTGDEPECFLGSGVRLADLKLEYTRSNEAIMQTAGRLKGELAADNCPNCGGSLTWPSGLTKHLICPSCRSEIDIGSDKLTLIQTNAMRGAQDRANTLKLGMVGKIDGVDYRVIGLVHQQEYPDLPISYTSRDISGGAWLPEAEFWIEYLLYHPQAGFLWLVETSDKKWYRADTLDVWPKLNANFEPTGNTPLYRYAGKVNYAAGAFYWRVQADDITLYRDYQAKGGTLSAAVTKQEMAWTQQKPLDIREVYQCFNLGEPPQTPLQQINQRWFGSADDTESGYTINHAIGLTMVYVVINFPLFAANWDIVLEEDLEMLVFVQLFVLGVIWWKWLDKRFNGGEE